MAQLKERVTATVDRALVRAGTEAVTSGRAASLSSWVDLALSERAAKDQRLTAMADAIAAYEAAFGTITAEEIAGQARADRRAGRVVSPSPKRRAGSNRGGRTA